MCQTNNLRLILLSAEVIARVSMLAMAPTSHIHGRIECPDWTPTFERQVMRIRLSTVPLRMLVTSPHPRELIAQDFIAMVGYHDFWILHLTSQIA